MFNASSKLALALTVIVGISASVLPEALYVRRWRDRPVPEISH